MNLTNLYDSVVANGTIDEDEVVKLENRINSDGKIDIVEKALLAELKTQNNGLPDLDLLKKVMI